MASVKRVVVYGGRGALGSVCVSTFKAHNWWVGCVDLNPSEHADLNVLVRPDEDWQTQSESVLSGIEGALNGEKLDAVLCVAGGWAGGSAKAKNTVQNSDLMWRQSVWSSVVSAQLSARALKEGGLLQLTGAKAALEGTPGMIGYGMAKAAVHQLVSSLAAEGGGMPARAAVLAILPITMDTPMNRKFMPDADHGTWTPLQYVADMLLQWADGSDRPASGSLVQLITEAGKTERVIQ